MGDVLSSIGSGIGTAASDVGGFFSGIGSDLFGGGGSTGMGAIPPAAQPIAAAPLPDISPTTASTPSAATSAASIANPFPNAGGLGSPEMDPSFGSVQAPNAMTAAQAGPQLTQPTAIGALTGAPGADVKPTGGILAQLFGGGAGGAGGAGGGHSDLIQKLLGTGLIGMDLIKATQKPAGVGALEQLAGQDKGLAKSFGAQAQGEAEGILPAGAQALIQNNLNANTAAIKTKYSQMGMSGSSAEVQDLNAARSQALAQTFAIGNQLSTQALNEVTSASGQEASLLQAIMSAETAQGTEIGDQLAQFAGLTTDHGATTGKAA